MFTGISEDDLRCFLSCSDARVRMYEKKEIIFEMGDQVNWIGILLSGQVDGVQEDYWGNQMLLGRFLAGDVIADAFVLAGEEAIPYTALSVRNSEMLMISHENLVSPCECVCPFHSQIILNMLSVSAKKSMLLLKKIRHITMRSMREKVLSFLSEEAMRAGSNKFTILYDRERLANYLGVDRSALSAELSRMQREGLLSYNKNAFELHR